MTTANYIIYCKYKLHLIINSEFHTKMNLLRVFVAKYLKFTFRSDISILKVIQQQSC